MQAATSRGALPLLQFAATRMWDARDRNRRVLTRAAYTQMGGVGGAFARHADEIVAAVLPESQPLLRAMLTRLVTAEGTRGVIDLDELIGLSKDRAEAERILDQLARGRLISVHTDPAAGSTVELIHEVPITEWTAPGALARGQPGAARLHGASLCAAVKQWVARGKPADLAVRGATAQEALAGIAKRHVLQLSFAEDAFLAAAALQQVSRGRRRTIGVAAGDHPRASRRSASAACCSRSSCRARTPRPSARRSRRTMQSRRSRASSMPCVAADAARETAEAQRTSAEASGELREPAGRAIAGRSGRLANWRALAQR